MVSSRMRMDRILTGASRASSPNDPSDIGGVSGLQRLSASFIQAIREPSKGLGGDVMFRSSAESDR